jgi:predicted RNA-binding protein Jag
MGAPSERRRNVSTTPEELLAQWKGLLGWDDLAWEQKSVEGGKPVYALTTSKAELLAGSDGRTLEAFEYLFNLVLARAPEDRDYLRFLVEGVDLEAKRFERAIDIAQRAAAEVRRSGRAYRLDPMPSPERKAIHQAFTDDPDVETVSEGEGPWRKIVLRPKPKAGGSAAPGKARLR